MLNRPLGAGVSQNPLVESPFFQQDDIGSGFNPIPPNGFVLLNNQGFNLLNGQAFLLLA